MNVEPTIYVVDDDEASRKSVCALVSTAKANVKTFESAENFLVEFDPTRPGCLVTDVRMMGMTGIELQEKLRADGVSLPVIVITAHAETPLTVRAIKSGAVTVLEKPCRDYELFDAIRAGLAEDTRIRAETARNRAHRDRLATLTPQEQAVLDLMIEGVANKVIARRLDISIRTVENRRHRIFEKTGAGSLAELIRLIVELCNNSPG